MTNFDARIKTLANSKTIKSHAKCQGVNIIHLAHRHLEIAQENDVLTITCGRHTVSLVLTKTRSGSLYPHWIRLNKALIELHTLVSDFHTWTKRKTKDDFAHPSEAFQFLLKDTTMRYIDVDLLGFSREHHRGEGLTAVKVRKQYRRIANLFHPDKGGDEQIFKVLRAAKDHFIRDIWERENPMSAEEYEAARQEYEAQ